MVLSDRWIEDGATTTAPTADLGVEREIVQTWRFEQPSDLDGWFLEPVDLLSQLVPNGLLLRSSHEDWWLRREIDVLAEDIDGLEIVQTHPVQGTVQVFWQVDGAPFSEDSSERSFDRKSPTLNFDLSAHPSWKGRVTGLRIDPTNSPGQELVLESITLWRSRVQPVSPAELERPRRIALSQRQMIARPAPPGTEWTRDVELSKGSRLSFSYGTELRSGPTVSFEVTAQTDAGTTQLFSTSLDPLKQGAVWHDATVDLSPLGKTAAQLTFRTTAQAPWNPRRGSPVWGNPELAAPGRTEQWNLLWIVIDTLRADRLSLYGYPRATSPALDAWAARQAAVFDNAIAQAPWTLPSHVSMFTGLGTLRHGVNHNLPAPARLTFLAEHLRNHGYSTMAVTGGGFVRPSFGVAQGFDRFGHAGETAGKPSPANKKDMADGLAEVLPWLAGRPAEPFFLFFHTYEVHSPFVASEPHFSELRVDPGGATAAAIGVRTAVVPPTAQNGYQVRSRILRTDHPALVETPPEQALIDDLYDSGVRTADAGIASILAQLESSGLADRTVVVVSSDHGESLGERGLAGHSSLYDEVLKVPLVIAWPDGRGRGQRIPTQVRLIDVAPTLTDSLNLPALPNTEGQTLLPLLGNPNADFPTSAVSLANSSNFGISVRIANRHKLIYQHSAWAPVAGNSELFDLEADPREQQNLASTSSDTTSKLVRYLSERFSAETSNLVVEAHNRSSLPMEFDLRGQVAHPFTAKGFDLPPGVLDYTPLESIVARIPPHRDVRFFLDGRPVGELVASFFDRAAAGLDPGLVVTITEESLVAPAVFCWHDGTWSRSHALAAGESGVTLRWKGALFDRGPSPAAVDDELREQLKALGYVD